MFHPFLFHNGFDSCHCHDVLADAMQLMAAIIVEQDLQDRRREEREREIRAEIERRTGKREWQ